MSTNYKFTYFNLKGLGEGVRFLFYYGNLNFDDIRVEIKDWMQLKPSKIAFFYNHLIYC